MCLRTAHHALAPPVLDNALRDFCPWSIVAVERAGCHVTIELGSIRGNLLLKSVEDFLREAAGIGRRLHHKRRYGADNCRLCHAALTMSGEIVYDLASSRRMSDVNGV